MSLTNEQQKDFETLCRPVMQFLNNNFNPHVTVTITPISAELVERIISTGTILDYVKD
jgi:hypothetical protein